MTTDDVYLTQEEVKDQYKISIPSLERWRQTGDGPAWVRFGPRRVLYRRADIEQWAEQRTYRHRADELSRKAG
jgi:predicted DNA-binding transcriptional regulator AlpA